MRLLSFHAEGFRNIERADISFREGVNVLLGNNAQGKTNAIEGIYLFARGRSFRSSQDKELVGFGKDGFHISIDFENQDGPQSLSYSFVGGQRRRRKNGYEIKKLSEFIGAFRAVLFTPDHLRLVKDSPEERRSFLNVAISQCYPSYVPLYADYKRAHEERSCLLKLLSRGMYVDRAELSAWSDSLAAYAADIYLLRRSYVEMLREHAYLQMLRISDGREMLTVAYKCDIDENLTDKAQVTEAYRRIYSESLSREMAAGTTLFGPVRDDLELSINGQSVRHFASQGQQRSCVLALKGAEAEVCRQISGEYPVMILDDVMSELDEGRRAYLLREVGDRQYIITGCDAGLLSFGGAHLTTVKDGVYVSSDR